MDDERRSSVPKDALWGQLWDEELVLDERITRTDTEAVLLFRGKRGNIIASTSEIREFMKKIGKRTIEYEDAETKLPDAEYDG